MKLVRLIDMYLNETYCKVRIGTQLSDSFTITIVEHKPKYVNF
jgi:hypothetical protein